MVIVAIVAGRKGIGLGLVGQRCRECAVAVLGHGDAIAGRNNFCRCIRSNGELDRATADKRSRFSGDADGGSGLSDGEVGRSGRFLVIFRCGESRLPRVAARSGRHRSAVSAVSRILDLVQIGYVVSTVGSAGRDRCLSRFAIRPAIHADGCRASGLGDGHIDCVACPDIRAVAIRHYLDGIGAALSGGIQRQTVSSGGDLLAVLHPCVEPVCARLLHRQGNGAVGVVGCADFAIFCRGVRSQCNIAALDPLGIVNLSSYRIPCNRASSTGFIVIPLGGIACAVYSIKTGFRCIYTSAVGHKERIVAVTGFCFHRICDTVIAYIDVFEIVFPSGLVLTRSIPVVNCIITNFHAFSKHITHIKYSSGRSVERTASNGCDTFRDINLS